MPDKQHITEFRQQHIGRLFQQATRDFGQRALQKLAQAGYSDLKPFLSEVISYIDLDGTRITTLAQRMGITKQTAGEAVAELEKLGYLTRTRDPADARATLLTFTPHGEAFLAAAHQVKQDLEQDYAQILGPEAFGQLKHFLNQILHLREP